MTKWRAFFIKIKSPGEDHREGRDAIRITEGPFADHVATVLNVAADKGRITAEISAFGHATKIELEAGFFEPLS